MIFHHVTIVEVGGRGTVIEVGRKRWQLG